MWANTYIDVNGNGVQDPGEPGLIQTPVRVRQVNGKPLNIESTDLDGLAPFDETFPAFAWYTVESDTTRYRGTGVHVVNDAGGPLDGPTGIWWQRQQRVGLSGHSEFDGDFLAASAIVVSGYDLLRRR